MTTKPEPPVVLLLLSSPPPVVGSALVEELPGSGSGSGSPEDVPPEVVGVGLCVVPLVDVAASVSVESPPSESQAVSENNRAITGTARRMADAGYRTVPTAASALLPPRPTSTPLVDASVSRQDEGVSTRAARLFGLAAVTLGLLAQPATAHSQANAQLASTDPDDVTPQSFHGSYVYAGGEAQRQAIRDEIDAATEDLNVAIRAIARRKIWKSQDPSRMMSITVRGDEVSIVRSGGKPDFSGTLGGGSFSVDKYRGRIKWKQGKLIVDISGGDQHTTVRYAIDPERRTLTVRTKIEHSMLPRPVKVKKTFRLMG